MVAPFGVLEWVNRRALPEAFPVLLLAFMSMLASCIALLMAPALRRLRAHRGLGALPLGHWAGLLGGALLGYVYLAVVVDQFPCFLGVPNCD